LRARTLLSEIGRSHWQGSVPDGVGFWHVYVIFIVKIVLHMWVCGVEKGAGLGKGWGQWLVWNRAGLVNPLMATNPK
jgi:hypothetical protein